MGGKGRHFRLGPRVSPERRHLLRLLSLLPAETPAPVSDGVRGPGTRVPRGRGASSWPAAIPRTHPPRTSVLHCRARGRGSPITSPPQDHSRYIPIDAPPSLWAGYQRVFIRNEPLKSQGPPRILSLQPRQLPPRDPPHAISIAMLAGQLPMSPRSLSPVRSPPGGVALVLCDQSCPPPCLTTHNPSPMPSLWVQKYFLFWPMPRLLFKNPFLQPHQKDPSVAQLHPESFPPLGRDICLLSIRFS